MAKKNFPYFQWHECKKLNNMLGRGKLYKRIQIHTWQCKKKEKKILKEHRKFFCDTNYRVKYKNITIY